MIFITLNRRRDTALNFEIRGIYRHINLYSVNPDGIKSFHLGEIVSGAIGKLRNF